MSEIKDFILHLRLNYNFLILSAPFLLGALYLPNISNVGLFIYLFLLVYIFLIGGANAYNSYFDKDEGPIGGLEHPPKMTRWMYYGSWICQLLGLLLSFLALRVFGLLFLFSILMSWLYSGPIFRFKSKPLFSFLIIGIGTGFNATLMGYYAGGGNEMVPQLFFGALGVTLMILSMYPFSQAYQIKEDARRGNITFAVKYGIQGIKRNYLILSLLGVLLLSYSFLFNVRLAIGTLLVGLFTSASIWQVVKTMCGRQDEYHKVMKTKYIGGISFTIIMLLLLIFL